MKSQDLSVLPAFLFFTLMTSVGVIHKVHTQEKGEGGLSKSRHPLFWWGHSFVKMSTRGEGGQIFDLFKHTYFTNVPMVEQNVCKLNCQKQWWSLQKEWLLDNRPNEQDYMNLVAWKKKIAKHITTTIV